MSLLSKASPKKTRRKKEIIEEPQAMEEIPELEVLQFSPENTTKKPDVSKESLIDKYKYKQDESDETPIIKVESLDKIPSDKKVGDNVSEITFDLLDLSIKCVFYLKQLATGPASKAEIKIRQIEKQLVVDKLDIYAKNSKEISYFQFKDRIFYYNDIVLLTEEQYPASGFLRKFFDINVVLVLTPSGKLERRNTLYCDYWDEAKLKNFMDFDEMDVQVKNEATCSRCPYKKG